MRKRFGQLLFSGLMVLGALGAGWTAAPERYAIQVGAFKNSGNAALTSGQLKKAGFPAYQKQTQDLTYVYVGDYPTAKAASSVLAKLGPLAKEGRLVAALPPRREAASSASARPALAQNEPAGTHARKIPVNEDLVAKQIHQSHIFFFYADPHWEMVESYLELIVAQSSIKQYQNSTLTLKVNNIPVNSVLLAGASGNARLKIPIPAAEIKPGFNEVQIISFRRGNSGPDSDLANPGNWLVIRKESFLYLGFREKPDTGAISDYPYPFLSDGGEAANANILISPVSGSPAIQAALLLAADFGQRRKHQPLNISVAEYDPESAKAGSHLIFIGGGADLPPEIKAGLTPAELGRIAKAALIKKMASPYDQHRKLLLICSDNRDALVKAAAALASDSLSSQMKTAAQTIQPGLTIPEEPETDSGHISLADLGYGNLLLKGLTQRAAYRIRLPKRWRIESGANLQLKLKYVKTLDFDQSYLTVSLNGTLLGSKKLSADKADDDLFQLAIPEQLRGVSDYNLKIESFLAAKDFDSRRFNPEGLWLQIADQSRLVLPHTDRDEPLLENYAGLFVNGAGFNDLLMVLPDRPSGAELRLAANLAAGLGREAGAVEGLQAVTAKEFKKPHQSRNLILVGDPGRNPLIAKLNPKLHLKFAPGFTNFRSDREFALLENDNGDLAAIQLIDSPYRNGRKAMVITAPKPEALPYAGPFLAGDSFGSQLKGSVALIDAAGQIRCAYYGAEPGTKPATATPVPNGAKPKAGAAVAGKNLDYLRYFLMALGIAVAVSYLMFRNHRRNQNKNKYILPR